MKTTIVGAGISGLATAHAILSGNPLAEVSVFESSERVGGKVWTETSPEGFICEAGVNGFLDKIPRTLQLCAEIGLTPVSANTAAQKRYVFSRQELHKLPETPPEFLTSRLLSVPGRLRVLWEILVGGTDKTDESLAEFAVRRLGREALEKLIDPMASGVFAGDATKMSLRSCFPRIHEVEEQYGSLIRGLVKLQMKARATGKKNIPGPGPGGRLTSFGQGMSALTDTLADRLGTRLHKSAPVLSISRDGEPLYPAPGRRHAGRDRGTGAGHPRLCPIAHFAGTRSTACAAGRRNRLSPADRGLPGLRPGLETCNSRWIWLPRPIR